MKFPGSNGSRVFGPPHAWPLLFCNAKISSGSSQSKHPVSVPWRLTLNITHLRQLRHPASWLVQLHRLHERAYRLPLQGWRRAQPPENHDAALLFAALTVDRSRHLLQFLLRRLTIRKWTLVTRPFFVCHLGSWGRDGFREWGIS